MKKYIIALVLFCIGLWAGTILFNHVYAWIGIIWTIIVIGIFINYIHKLFKNYNNEKP